MSRERDVDVVRRVLLRRMYIGEDVGEFLVDAVIAAQTHLDGKPAGESLTQNRPGSWEAALVEQMLSSGGYYARMQEESQ